MEQYDEDFQKFYECSPPLDLPGDPSNNCERHARHRRTGTSAVCTTKVGECDATNTDNNTRINSDCHELDPKRPSCQLDSEGNTICVPGPEEIGDSGIVVDVNGHVNCSWYERLHGPYTRCTCKHGYFGDHCDMKPPDHAISCSPTSSRDDKTKTYTCICKEGWKGDHCSVEKGGTKDKTTGIFYHCIDDNCEKCTGKCLRDCDADVNCFKDTGSYGKSTCGELSNSGACSNLRL